MPRKPDRFERQVEDLEFYGLETRLCESRDVIKLIRKEHAWMRRMIHLYDRSINGFEDKDLDEQFKAGYSHACFDILNQLTQRRK